MCYPRQNSSPESYHYPFRKREITHSPDSKNLFSPTKKGRKKLYEKIERNSSTVTSMVWQWINSFHSRQGQLQEEVFEIKFPVEFLLNNTEIMCKQYKRKQIPFFRNTIKNIVLFSKSLCQPKALTKNTKTFHLTAFQTQIISNIELVSNLPQKFPKSTGILGEKLVDKYWAKLNIMSDFFYFFDLILVTEVNNMKKTDIKGIEDALVNHSTFVGLSWNKIFWLTKLNSRWISPTKWNLK